MSDFHVLELKPMDFKALGLLSIVARQHKRDGRMGTENGLLFFNYQLFP